MLDKTHKNMPDDKVNVEIDNTALLAKPVISQMTENSGPEESPTTPGKFNSNRYDIQKELGGGAFGIVYRAWDKNLKRLVALKILKKCVNGRASTIQQFLTEAQAMAAITNDHVMPVLDFGVEDGQPFISMPLLGGETLHARVEREGALPNSEIVRISREIVSGLAAIHAKGFLHRDLKPNNIWLEAGSARVKILDFGLAHNPLEDPEGLAGTPAYMSPEQASGHPLDARSDLFSLGSVLYFCATGRQPFRGESLSQLLDSVQKNDPPSLPRLNPGLSLELAGLIGHLLKKKPEDRPASAWEVMDRLAEPAPSPKPHISRRWAISAAGAACSGMALLALAMSRWSRDSEPSAVPPANVPPQPPGTERLRVKSLNVLHFAKIDAKTFKPRGVVGRDSFEVHLEDEIEVRAELNRPSYCYLILFRPDGQAAVLYPQDETDVPERTVEPVYPSKRREHRYGLEENEKPGLWMVAAFVSENPLPRFADWRLTLAGNPWQPVPQPVPQLVLMHDGVVLDILGPASGGGARASRVSGDKSKTIVEAMIQWFESQGASATAAVGFPVEPVKSNQP